VTSVGVTYLCIVRGLNRVLRGDDKFGQRLSDVTLQIGQQFTNTVKTQLHVPAFCVFCNLRTLCMAPVRHP